MEIHELEKRLRNGEIWGFRKPTDSDDYLGWVLVNRRRVAPITPFDPQEEPEKYARWRKRADAVNKEPFMVWIVELNRAVHESRGYPDGDDFRVNESRNFPTLQAVEQVLKQLGFDIADIKPSREIDAP